MKPESWLLLAAVGVGVYLIFRSGAVSPGGPSLPAAVSVPAGTPLVTQFPEIAVTGTYVPAGASGSFPASTVFVPGKGNAPGITVPSGAVKYVQYDSAGNPFVALPS